MRINFSSYELITDTIDFLEPHERSQFWARYEEAARKNHEGAPTYLGNPYFLSHCQVEGPSELVFEGEPPPAIRDELNLAQEDGVLYPQGFNTPNYLVICLGLNTHRARAVIIHSTSFRRFLVAEFSDLTLTPAETDLLQQILVGQDLKTAAVALSKGYETIRTNFKAVSKKFGLSRQAEVVGTVLGRLLVSISETEAIARRSTLPDPLNSYCERFLPAEVRVHHLLDENGNKHSVLDIGDRRGMPVLCAHQMVMTFFRQGYIDALKRLGLRLILPLRFGTLAGPEEPPTPDNYLELAIAGMRAAHSAFCDSRCVVVGFSNGTNYATAFAGRYPELTTKLVLISSTLMPKRGKSVVDRTVAAFVRMSLENRTALKLFIDYMIAIHRTEERFMKTFELVSRSQGADYDILRREFSEQRVVTAYLYYYRNSPALLKSDMHARVYLKPATFTAVTSPVLFVHGDANPWDSLDAVQTLAAALPNSCIRTIKGAGHVMRFEHLKECYQLIKDACEVD